MVRGRTAKPKKRATKTSATKTTISSTKAPITNKADFVRARLHLSPKEIVEDAKATGVKLDVGYVYNVRGATKTAAKRKVTALAARRSTARRAPPVVAPTATTSSAEELLRAAAAEIGLGRAIELLLGERARVHAVLRG
jgi:hypothetical protein